MELEECYRELGVGSDANLSEVKLAFRRLSLEYHPDRNLSPEAEAKFSAVAEAYHTIVSSWGVVTKPADDLKDVVDEPLAGGLSFTIMTDKEVVHSASQALFESEVRKNFNPNLPPGTFCRIGRRWFEISENSKAGRGFLLSHRREFLTEWYKAPDGSDKWKKIRWDEFWSYARRYASSAK
jgi:hypothetical protein